jgi:micrococcal nuclease
VPERPRSTFYENCDAVRAVGAAPLHRDEPGYRPALDRDGDGIACEPK